MTPERRQIRLLASVTSESEARVAALCGADIIDCKDPAAGALGALPADVVAAIRAAVPRKVPVSATLGDLPCAEPGRIADGARAIAKAGADFVKVGVFAPGDAAATIKTLGALDLGRCELVGVLFADRTPDFALIEAMARAAFVGAMLDTADKSRGALADHLSHEVLKDFVARVHEAGLFAGLAGSLRATHVAALAPLAPDVLGFRGALCKDGDREAAVDAAALLAVKGAVRGAGRGQAGRRVRVEERAQ